MITRMKKLTFLVFYKEYKEFLDRMGELGVLHVIEKQQGALDDAAFSLNILVHLVKATVIVNFKLLVALNLIAFLAAVFAFVITNTRRNTCGYLGSGNLYNAVSKGLALSG